jgi:hypothetical protein
VREDFYASREKKAKAISGAPAGIIGGSTIQHWNDAFLSDGKFDSPP